MITLRGEIEHIDDTVFDTSDPPVCISRSHSRDKIFIYQIGPLAE